MISNAKDGEACCQLCRYVSLQDIRAFRDNVFRRDLNRALLMFFLSDAASGQAGGYLVRPRQKTRAAIDMGYSVLSSSAISWLSRLIWQKLDWLVCGHLRLKACLPCCLIDCLILW